MIQKYLLLFLFSFISLSVSAETGLQLLNRAKQQTDPAAQIKLLNKAISKAPKLADAYHYRADAYLASGKINQALTDYSKTVSLRPKDPFRYYARGLAYMQAGRASLAQTDLTKAISLKPAHRNFYLARARANTALNKFELALADYKKYLG